MKSKIGYSDMVSKLAKPGTEILETLDPLKCHMIHMCLGIAGEYGELEFELEALKDGVLNHNNIVKEFGDLEFYLEGLRQAFNIERYDGARHKTSESLMAYTGSIGILIDIIKKGIAYNKDFPLDKLKNAFNDVECLLEYLRRTAGVSRTETIDMNMEKLAERYNNFVYSDNAAVKRVDVK